MHPSESLDELVVLEPSVELVRENASPDGGQSPRRRHSLLVNHRWRTAIVAPGGDDMAGLLDTLRHPRRVGDIADEIGELELTARLTSSMVNHGYLYRVGRVNGPPVSSIDDARAAWWSGARSRLRTELSQGPLDTIDHAAVTDPIRAAPVPASVRLSARSLAAIGDLLVELAGQRRSGRLRYHALRIRVADGAAARPVMAALAGLRAVVECECGPGGELPPWVPVLIAERVPVVASHRLDVGLLRDRAYGAWVARHRLAGVRIDGWAEALEAGAIDGDALAGGAAALEDEVGWVELVGLPGDAVVFGEELAAQPREAAEHDAVAAYRRRHLRDRAMAIRSAEGRQVWAQLPAAEDLWVSANDDYVPRHPEELGIRPGVKIADIAAGFGRVARRISSSVGPDGAIVCVEKSSVAVERARRFAAEGGFDNMLVIQGLAERLPLASASFDLAIMEWAGQVMRTLANQAVAEMTRVVRPGGRVIVTHRLVQLVLADLQRVEAHAPDVFVRFQEAFEGAGLVVEARRFWGCTDQMSGQPRAWFEERFLPRAVDSLEGATYPAFEPTADIYLTLVGRKPGSPGSD